MSNTEIWDKLKRVPPEHLKSFERAGGFKGTAIKPMWTIHRMTEVFGPIGKKWGIGEPRFETHEGKDGELLVFCYVPIWFDDEDGNRDRFFGVGGDKVIKYIKANERYNRPERWENDDEAYKKSYTDAVTNALKMLGAGADVHMGLWDGNKYIDEKQDAEPAPEPKKAYERNGIVKAEFDRLTKGIRQIENSGTLEDLALFWKNNSETIKHLPVDWREILEESKDEAKAALSVKATA